MSNNEWPERMNKKPTLLVQRTVRGGQSVNFDGNVVILGDVNPGAEIIASGHVLVMGSMRGVVHAGAAGDDDARVTALTLAPTQLRIASHITRPPDGGYAQTDHMAEMALIRDDTVSIEEYLPPR